MCVIHLTHPGSPVCKCVDGHEYPRQEPDRVLFGDLPADETPEGARRRAAFEMEATPGEAMGEFGVVEVEVNKRDK